MDRQDLPVSTRRLCFAQLLSEPPIKKPRRLWAAKLINGGFNAAYVERRDKRTEGAIFRFRGKFASEADAHARNRN
jgi:hypothetical protein